MKHLLRSISLLLFAFPLLGAFALEPVLSRRGALLFEDTFEKGAPKPEWKALHGTRWSVEDGVFRGKPSTAEYQQSRDHHTGSTPSMTLVLPMHDCIVEMDFKMEGALKAVHFGFNDGTTTEGTGHVCRAIFDSGKGSALQKDTNSQLEDDTDETLVTDDWKPEPGKWNMVLFEVRGDRFAAAIDGGPALKAKHPRIDVPKSWLNLKSRGANGSLSYDNVRIWKALPAKGASSSSAWKKHVVKRPALGMINSAVANDFDRDGHMDVLSSYDGAVVLLKGPGWTPSIVHTFVPGDSRTKPRDACIHSCLMDVDGDGDQDFCGSNNTVFWLECPDDPFSGKPWTYRTVDDEILGTHCLITGDVNRDGKLDLIANSGRTEKATAFPDSLTWLEVPKNPHKATHWIRHVFGDRDAPGGSHYTGFGDVNGDGRPDIACAAKGGEGFEGGEWFAWWEQPADPAAAWKKHLLAAGEPGATNIIPADLDADGHVDYVATRGHGRGVLWFKGPDFAQFEIDPEIEGPHCLVLADLDGDGDPDAATCSRDTGGEMAWDENDGSAAFTKHVIGIDQGSYDIRAVDMDADTDLDLLIAGHTSRNIVWFENPN